MKLSDPFVRHPASVGESYGEHFAQASMFGARLIVAGCACLVHAVLPFLLTVTGSNSVIRLHREMVLQRRNTGSTSPVAGEVDAT